jgi:hypothetical protein
MKLDKSIVIILFVVSMFAGIIIISLGIGAAFPVINRVAGPFVCSTGKMMLESEKYSGLPGQSTTTIKWLCVDNKTDAQQDINFKVILVAGTIYGLILFALIITRWLVVNRPGADQPATPISPLKSGFSRNVPIPETKHQKLQEIKELHDSGLISDQDYEKKKSEILEEI